MHCKACVDRARPFPLPLRRHSLAGKQCAELRALRSRPRTRGLTRRTDMTRRLEGKIALVNGGGSSGPGWGNGKATAVQFAREGAKVVVLDIKRAAAEETAALIAGEGGKALVIQADVTSESDMQNMVARTMSKYGRLDILAQIVGISSRLPFFEETEA